MNKEKLHIRLHVYDEEVEVTIDREEEIYYRAAAKLITDRYNRYAQVFKGKISDEELAARKANWVCPEPKIKTGYLARYAKLVSSADKGAILQ